MDKNEILTVLLFADEKSDDRLPDTREAIRYLVGLYLYAHGDGRFSNVLDSVAYENYEKVVARSTVPRFFHEYLSEDNPHGLTVKRGRNGLAVYVSIPEGKYPYTNLAKKQNAVAVACFEIFNGLSRAVEVTERYTIDKHTLKWLRYDGRAPIGLVMDAIVDNRITACPTCGTLVLKKSRGNASPFCKPAHATTYERRARSYLMAGASIDEVRSRFEYVNAETINKWVAALRGGVNNGEVIR